MVVSAIGTGQLLAWGSTYYLPAVLAGPIAADTGWPIAWIFGALSVGLLVSGLVSPRVGHLIERRGGRPVLTTGSMLLGIGLLGLGLSPTLPLFMACWVVIGVGMGAGLYDPAFSALGRLYGADARSAITQVTLFGGLASSFCWPLTALLADQFGWRGACLAYAAIHLVVVVPFYLLGMPREAARVTGPHSAARLAAGRLRPDQRAAFILLAAGFTLAFVLMTIVAVQILALLQAQGLSLAAAVALGALIGPSQVAGRIVEMFCRRPHPLWSLLVSSVLIVIGLLLLLGGNEIAAAGIIFYGMGSGIRSIVRGTVPLAVFGQEGYAVMMGRLALPSLLATAAAPLLGSWLLDTLGASTMLALLAAAAVVNAALVLPLMPIALRR